MAVIPDGELRLIPDIALDPRYEHTLWFDSAQEQADYFISKSTRYFTKMSYQRVGENAIRVQGTIGTLDQMCYMMFRNTVQTNHPYGNKWFYAFITSAKYLNENTVELTYELDIMQTWLFECHLNKCFVEREHSKTDVAGDNIVPESIPTGEYLYTLPTHPSSGSLTMNDLSLVVAYNEGTFDIYGKIVEINENWGSLMTRWKNMYIGGTYYGISFIAMPLTSSIVKDLDGLMSNISMWNTIISSFVIPTMFLPPEQRFNDYNVRTTMTVNRNTDFDGYEPQNQKLFTYPYTCAYLTSFRGKGNEFAFEYFAPKGSATFNVEGALSMQPSVMAYPTNYRKVSKYLEGAVSIRSFPMCTWGEDGLTEWINNNLFRDMMGIVTSPVTSKLNEAEGKEGGGIAYESVKTAIGAVNSIFDPGTVHGTASSDLLFGSDYGRRIMGFCKHLTYQSARMVDEYFSVYGYAVNRFKVPDRANRPCWNYIKTKGCTAHGYLPASDLRAICDIYDKGITFWKKDATIGSYNFDANKLT